MNETKENSSLPEGWKRTKLGEVCKLKNGFAFKSSEYNGDGIPIIRISDIKSGYVKPDKSVRINSDKIFDEYVINENDILVAMSGATTGKFGIFKGKEKAYQNQRVGKFQISNENVLDNNFLLYQLHALKGKLKKMHTEEHNQTFLLAKLKQWKFCCLLKPFSKPLFPK